MAKGPSGRLCAYCGQAGSLTREHVHPAFLIRYSVPEGGSVYNHRLDKFLPSEGVIRDVCSDCNSGPLSDLDDYGRAFVESNRCDRQFRTRRSIFVRYDFDLLLRWLMKISYNSARWGGHDATEIRPWIPYILGDSERPFPAALHVEVVQDYVVDRADMDSYPEEVRRLGVFPAVGLRSGPLLGLAGASRGARARLVGINAFHFYVLWVISDKYDPARLPGLSKALREQYPQALRLSQTSQSRRLRVSKRTVLDARQGQDKLQGRAWSRYVESREGR